MTISITVSQEVAGAIRDLAHPGEVPDDTLRRILGLSLTSPEDVTLLWAAGSRGAKRRPAPRGNGVSARRLADRKMSAKLASGRLHLTFQGGDSRSWTLPPKGSYEGIRSLLTSAQTFASSQGATVGQLNAVRKTLTDSGSHLTK